MLNEQSAACQVAVFDPALFFLFISPLSHLTILFSEAIPALFDGTKNNPIYPYIWTRLYIQKKFKYE